MKNIWVNGCFDILHVGHIRLLKYAKSLGDRLIVGIDSDTRVNEMKGLNRPINSDVYRKEMLLSIKWVDDVLVFDSEISLITAIKDHNISVMVVGDDYINKKVVGSEYVESLIYFSRIPNISTTILLKNNIISD
jgi:D-beta-D-heptose 7-phosphate kinase/D-beta-D-heptose 1-phosphate adenosyltransferase